MSLLLDALKKAALEKQRRQQDVQVPTAAPEQAQAEPSTLRSVGVSLLANWAGAKQAKIVYAEEAAAVCREPPGVHEPFSAAIDVEPTAVRVGIESAAIGSVVDAELGPELGAGAPPEQKESCDFIDISDLDFASLVGFQVEPPNEHSLPSGPLNLTEQPVVVVAEAKQAEAKQAEAKQAEAKQAEAKQTEAKQTEAKQAAASQAEVKPAAASQPPAAESADTLTPVQGAPASAAQIPEPQPTQVAQAAAEAGPVAPTQYSQQGAKQALAALLDNSKQAASRNRRRVLRLYGLLVVTGASLVGFYYYWLQSANSAVLAVAVPTAVKPAPSDGQLIESQLAEPQLNENPNPQATPGQQVLEPAAAEPINPALAAQAAPATMSASEPVLVPAELRGTKLPGAGVIEPAAAPTPADGADTSEDTPESGGAYTGETLTPVDVPIRSVPIRTGVTEVLAYHPVQADELSTAIERGYAAFEAGDLPTAAAAYQSALQLDPFQRDALLGAAAVALQQGRPNEALNYYQQRLARAPKDDFALAGLLAISAQAGADPELDAQLSRLIATYPQAAHLYYLQGTVYAQRQQWGAAQLALLAAWQRDNTNPDIACNLAIAFDHLQQPDEAARFYRQALRLANGQAVNFTPAAIRTRLGELEAGVRGAEVKERKR